MKYHIALSALLLFALQVNSQPNLEWVRTYNNLNNDNDFGYDIGFDSTGNLVCIGQLAFSNQSNKIIIIKYKQDGSLIWQKIFNHNNTNNEYPVNSVIDNQSNICVLSEDYTRLILSKWDSSGNQLFAKKISNQNYGGIKLLTDKINNLYILHMISGTNIILKYSSEGNLLWEWRIVNSDIWLFNAILDHDNNLYVSGSIYEICEDLLLIKFSPAGDSLWSKKYNSGLCDFGMFLTIDNNNNIIVTGQSAGTPFNFESYIFTTIKYSPEGNMIWLRKYDGGGWGADIPNDIVCDNNNNIYVTGSTKTTATGEDYVTIKYNSAGDTLWTIKYNGFNNYNDKGKKIAVDDFQNAFVTGYSQIPGTGTDITTIKYDRYGNEKWVIRYSNSDTNYYNPLNLILDSLNNIYINSTCWFQGQNLDIITLKYHDKPIGIKPVSSEIPDNFALSQNYPNPFNPTTKIKFSIPPLRVMDGDRHSVLLKIYDIKGSEVALIVNEQLKPGIYEAEFDGTSYSSGIYFYKLISGNYIESRKMVLLK